jgi:hypothetical protein
MPPAIPQLPDPSTDPVLVSYANYLEAQQAVDTLSDNRFPVQKVAIVGVDLRMVEQVIGRMSWGRAAAGGLMTGAWFGLLLGLFVSFFASAEESNPTSLIVLGLVYGAGFGIIFGLVSYWMTGGKRDFLSRSQVIANRYDVHVTADGIADARKILGLSAQWPPPLPDDVNAGGAPADGDDEASNATAATPGDPKA